MLRVVMITILALQTVPVSSKVTFKNVEFTHPPSLTLMAQWPPDYFPVLTNFGKNYIPGGIIPQNGLEIMVMEMNKNGRTLESVLTQSIAGTQILANASLQLAGRSASKIVRIVDFKKGFRTRTTTIFFEHGPVFYVFILSTNIGDSGQKSSEAIFDALLRTVRFQK